ncbi:hypothetical protein EVA_17935, partial [gut metagenome]
HEDNNYECDLESMQKGLILSRQYLEEFI